MVERNRFGGRVDLFCVSAAQLSRERDDVDYNKYHYKTLSTRAFIEQTISILGIGA